MHDDCIQADSTVEMGIAFLTPVLIIERWALLILKVLFDFTSLLFCCYALNCWPNMAVTVWALRA